MKYRSDKAFNPDNHSALDQSSVLYAADSRLPEPSTATPPLSRPLTIKRITTGTNLYLPSLAVPSLERSSDCDDCLVSAFVDSGAAICGFPRLAPPPGLVKDGRGTFPPGATPPYLDRPPHGLHAMLSACGVTVLICAICWQCLTKSSKCSWGTKLSTR